MVGLKIGSGVEPQKGGGKNNSYFSIVSDDMYLRVIFLFIVMTCI